jgi:hypothetical protein
LRLRTSASGDEPRGGDASSPTISAFRLGPSPQDKAAFYQDKHRSRAEGRGLTRAGCNKTCADGMVIDFPLKTLSPKRIPSAQTGRFFTRKKACLFH